MAGMQQKAPIHVPTFIFIGGPEIHAGYVTRLFKAEAAGKITFDRVVIVDRDPDCAARAIRNDRVRIDAAPWNDWLAANLSIANEADHLVPYHWAPHVLLDWLSNDLARDGVSLRRSAHQGDPPARPPVVRDTQGGDLALSYAEWLCPVACIEPALCPHTRGPKSWSLATELRVAARSFVFPCMHLAYGVGTIPLAAILRVRREISALASSNPSVQVDIWIGTASHCHGLAARARLGRAFDVPAA